jgi:outer membrane murein-binding lipoprotein Lpp
LPLVYRTLASVPEDDGDLVAAASAVFSRWLSKRGNSGARVDFSCSGHYELSNRSRALVVRHDNPEEGLTFLRLTTESDKPDGVWRTIASVVVDPALSPSQHLWIDMTVDAAPREESPADQPRLDVMPPEAARMLLEEVRAHDGAQPLPAGPRIVRGRDDTLVDTLVSAIGAADRRLAVVATGTPRDVTVAGWRDAMAGALSRSTGMCAGYVLDAAAIERVGALLPRGLDIPTGGVRTFLPAVDVADETDHPRHPRMSPATLDTAREGDRIRNWVGAALSRRVRETALETDLPAPLAAVDALLDEETKDLRLRAWSRADRGPAAAPGRGGACGTGGNGGHGGHGRADDQGRVPSARHPLGEAAGAALASAQERDAQEQQVQRLREEVKRLSARISELSDERQELLAETADLAEEVDTARDQLRAARFEARWLRERVREEGLFRLAATPAPRDPQQRPPVTVRELLDRITDGSALPHLFFTIEDHDTVHELSDSRKETLWVTRAWEALLALNDYARYQFDNPGSGLGFHSYLRETPDGYQVIPVKRLASQESDYVRNRGKLNEKRLFRVPTEVEPSGRVPMYAHIKLDIEYGICPRLYFYPHLGPGTTNRVYIGYLGRHLPVQQSN